MTEGHGVAVFVQGISDCARGIYSFRKSYCLPAQNLEHFNNLPVFFTQDVNN